MRIESFDVNAFALFFFFSFPAEARESEAGGWKEWGGGGGVQYPARQYITQQVTRNTHTTLPTALKRAG